MYCCRCCCCCRIWRMLLGRRWKWPSVRLNACRTFSGGSSLPFPRPVFLDSLFFPLSLLCRHTQNAIDEATEVLLLLLATDYMCDARLWKALTQKKRRGRRDDQKEKKSYTGPHVLIFLFSLFIFEIIPRENSYQMSSCIGSAQTKKKTKKNIFSRENFSSKKKKKKKKKIISRLAICGIGLKARSSVSSYSFFLSSTMTW